MNLIGLKEIIEQYGMGTNFWRTNLCRPEFNKFLYKGKNSFYNLPEFHIEIKKILIKKSINNSTKWKIKKYSTFGGVDKIEQAC